MSLQKNAFDEVAEQPSLQSGSGHQHKVSQLYDKLFSFEVKKAKKAYPIHKKLVFEEPGITDIYHWLIHHLPLEQCQHILDAGCGVGFGSQELFNNSNAVVTGISLSADEIAQAQEFKQRAVTDASKNSGNSRKPEDLRFQQLSFEELPVRSFDCVLMVESLKHCSDLEKAMASVSQSLQNHGVCYLVEDIYVPATSLKQDSLNQQPLNQLLLNQKSLSKRELNNAQQLCADWHLKKLYTLEDLKFAASENNLELQLHSDLTSLMRLPSSAINSGKLALFTLLSSLASVWKSRKASVWPIYRGGFILDWFYLQNKMRYQVLELRRV